MQRLAQQHDQLESWESWPAWALGVSQGLNIFLWYVLSLEKVSLGAGRVPMRIPEIVLAWLPLAVVIAAAAAAASLDGAMVATVAGSRVGRNGRWSWVAALAATVFSAGIALDIHGGGFVPGAWLHIAQPFVLFCYMMHLRQRKNALHSTGQSASNDSNGSNHTLTNRVMQQQQGFKCRFCDETFDTASDVRKHQRNECQQRLETFDLHRSVAASKQANLEPASLNGKKV